MVRQWTHGHTFLAGGAAGVVLGTHTVWVGVVCFAAGIMVGRLWRYTLAFGWALRARLER